MAIPTNPSDLLVLPFTIDEHDFTDWLNSLIHFDEVTCCEQILRVLKTLNKTHHALASKTRLFFLTKLSEALLPQTERLTSAEFSIEKSKAYLAIWSCSELSNAYLFLSEEKRFLTKDYYSPAEKQHIILMGFQAMSKALLYISQIYSKPYLNFWSKCYHFYQQAILGLLSDPEQALTNIPEDFTAIDAIFKQLLVFSLSNSNQFTPKEMQQVHHYLLEYAGNAKLLAAVPDSKFTGTPIFNLKYDLPPTLPSFAKPALDERTLYIATVTVAGKILQSLAEKNKFFSVSERALLKRLTKILALNRNRKFPREQDSSQYFGIIGFNNLISYFRLHHQNPDILLNIGQPDLSRPGELRELNFEILSHEEDFDKLRSRPYSPKRLKPKRKNTRPDIWQTAAQPELTANSTQIDKSQCGYSLIWQDQLTDPRVGDIIGVRNQQPSIALIRWIAKSPTSSLLFGAELLGLDGQAVKVNNIGLSAQKIDAIHLVSSQANNTIESLVFSSSFTAGEFIFVQRFADVKRYRIAKLLNETSLLKHVEIVTA